MEIPEIDHDSGLVAAILFAVAVAYKVWLKLKGDTREDKSEDARHAAQDALVVNQSDEIKRLYRMVRDLGEKLDDEIARRRGADERVAVLELAIRKMGGVIPPLEGL